MVIKCNKCGKRYNGIFDTTIHCDYSQPGKGKPYEWHLCIECRRKIIDWIGKDNF